MRFIIIILCIAIQRMGWVRPWLWSSHLWDNYLVFWQKKLGHTIFSKGYVGFITMMLVPIFLLVGIMSMIFSVFGGVGYFIASFFMLWLVMDAHSWCSDENASLWMSDSSEEHWNCSLAPKYILKILWPAHQQMFAIIFWFALGGPIWVFAYMSSIVLLQRLRSNSLLDFSVRDAAEWLHAVFDWLPQRILAFSFSLVGEFTASFSYWRQHVTDHFQKSSDIVMGCGETALGGFDLSTENDVDMQKDQLIGLLNRTLWLYLTSLAVLVIALFW